MGTSLVKNYSVDKEPIITTVSTHACGLKILTVIAIKIVLLIPNFSILFDICIPAEVKKALFKELIP